jgi:hypothetical protein
MLWERHWVGRGELERDGHHIFACGFELDVEFSLAIFLLTVYIFSRFMVFGLRCNSSASRMLLHLRQRRESISRLNVTQIVGKCLQCPN